MIQIVQSRPELARQLELLVYAAYDGDPTQVVYTDVSAERFVRHTEIFPEGQFTALDVQPGLADGEPHAVGMTTSMIIQYDPAQPLLQSWYDTTDNGWLTGHNPAGNWLYGVETVVHPNFQRQGVGSGLMNARFDTVRKLNLRGMIAGSLFVDYAKVADQMTVEAYVAAVVAGDLYDSNLTKQLHKGFRVVNLIPNYVEEPRTRDYAAAILWENPDWG